MRHVLLAAGLVLAVPPGTTPAVAEEAGVRVTYEPRVVSLNSGYLVAVLCNATADPGRLEQVALATVVTCTVNDETIERRGNQGMPGPEAFAEVPGSFAGEAEVTVCVSGQAVFADLSTRHLVFVATPVPVCSPLQLPG